MKRISRLAIATAMSLCLTVAAGTALAFASTTQAEAKTKTVYVITKKTHNVTSPSQYVGTETTTYAYNKKGLLTKLQGADKVGTWTFKYNSKNLVKSANNKIGTQVNATFKLSYNSKGNLTKVVRYDHGNKASTTKRSYTSTGKLKKDVTTFTNGFINLRITKYVCDKNKRVKSMSSAHGSTYEKSSPTNYNPGFRFSYDKKGNLKFLLQEGSAYSVTKKHSYKKSRIISSTGYDTNSHDRINWTEKNTYKKMRVSSKLAKKVQAQQRAIANGETDRLFQTF